MAYEMYVIDDGILRILMDENLEDELDAFKREFMAHLEAATPEKPLRTLSSSMNPGSKLPPAVRKAFADLNRDPRLGKSATLGVDRYTRVLAGFVLRATRRKNVQFFDTEKEAVAWLKEES